MQYQALRGVASSRLMLFAVIARFLTFLLTVALLWFFSAFRLLWQDAASVYDKLHLTFSDYEALLRLATIGAVFALPVIAAFLIFLNARSGKPLRRAGYSFLRAISFFRLVVCALALALFLSIFSDSKSLFALSIAAELLTMLLLSIAAAGALKTARQIAVNGSTCRRLTYFLPVTLILSICVQAANLIAVILDNYFPSAEEVQPWYHIGLSPLDHLVVAAGAAGLVSTILFLLVDLRAIKALSAQRGPVTQSTDAIS